MDLIDLIFGLVNPRNIQNYIHLININHNVSKNEL